MAELVLFPLPSIGKVAVEGLMECLDFSALIHYELNFSEAECLYFQIFSVYLSSFDMSDIVSPHVVESLLQYTRHTIFNS
jgi:hypothetical protein